MNKNGHYSYSNFSLGTTFLLSISQGSFVCGPCNEGYVERGPLNCVLADPCSADEHNCERREYCINHEVGEYYCKCPVGMFGNGRQCAPDDDLDGVPNTNLTIGCDNPPCPVVSHTPTTKCISVQSNHNSLQVENGNGNSVTLFQKCEAYWSKVCSIHGGHNSHPVSQLLHTHLLLHARVWFAIAAKCNGINPRHLPWQFLESS